MKDISICSCGCGPPVLSTFDLRRAMLGDPEANCWLLIGEVVDDVT